MPPPFGPHLKRVPCPEGSCQSQCGVTAMTRPFMSPFVSPSLFPTFLSIPLSLSLHCTFSSNHAQEERGNVFGLEGEIHTSTGCARANDWEMLSQSSYPSPYAALHYLPGPQTDVFLSPVHVYRSPCTIHAQNCWIFTGESGEMTIRSRMNISLALNWGGQGKTLSPWYSEEERGKKWWSKCAARVAKGAIK